MTNRAVLLQEIETLPDACVSEVVDFAAWIKPVIKIISFSIL